MPSHRKFDFLEYICVFLLWGLTIKDLTCIMGILVLVSWDLWRKKRRKRTDLWGTFKDCMNSPMWGTLKDYINRSMWGTRSVNRWIHLNMYPCEEPSKTTWTHPCEELSKTTWTDPHTVMLLYINLDTPKLRSLAEKVGEKDGKTFKGVIFIAFLTMGGGGN